MLNSLLRQWDDSNPSVPCRPELAGGTARVVGVAAVHHAKINRKIRRCQPSAGGVVSSSLPLFDDIGYSVSPTVNKVPERIVIATRESRLALWQAEHVRDLLAKLYPSCRVELLGMTTRGDQILDRPLAKVGGKGLFVKELETAMLDGRADIAVHSMKDVPMELPPEFALVATGPREVPLDAFVSSKYANLDDLPPGAVVGTSSLRREAQLHARYPYLAVSSLRGNLDTRLRKLDEGQYDAIILAAAGLTRLGLKERIRAVLPAEVSLPAAGQGALGIEAVASRPEVAAWLAPLNDPVTEACVRAERAVSRALAGSCEVPLGAYAVMREGALWVRGFVATPDGKRMAHAELTGPATEPEALGLRLAADLRAQGADAILASLPGSP
jgi:hydroxymethylbilane synthase